MGWEPVSDNFVSLYSDSVSLLAVFSGFQPMKTDISPNRTEARRIQPAWVY